jgi:ABC-2 type transport system permease protein
MTTGASEAGPVPSRVLWGPSAMALLRLSWARTMTPAVLAALVALVLLPMLFAIAFAARGALSGDPVEFLLQRTDQLIGGLATPLFALLLGTSAFAAESEDGTLHYLVTTTTPRWWITLVRTGFAAVGTALLSAATVWGTGWIAANGSDPEGVSSAFTIATAFGGATYAALFTLLALMTRRALVTGLGYILIWEGTLASALPGLKYLSVRQWMLAVAEARMSATTEALEGAPPEAVAWVGGAVVVGMAVHLGGRWLGGGGRSGR